MVHLVQYHNNTFYCEIIIIILSHSIITDMHNNNMYFSLYSITASIACTYYIEIRQEVTNENAITLVYYLAQQNAIIPHVMLALTFIIEPFCLISGFSLL